MINYNFYSRVADPTVHIVKQAEREAEQQKMKRKESFELRVENARRRKDERIARAWELHKQGKKQVEIAKDIGVTRQAIAKYIKHMEELHANQN